MYQYDYNNMLIVLLSSFNNITIICIPLCMTLKKTKKINNKYLNMAVSTLSAHREYELVYVRGQEI